MAAKVVSPGKMDVQGYLAKHKIAALFEDLMAKVIKQLPDDPLEFLIRKLQFLHQKHKKAAIPSVPSIGSTKAAHPGRKLQVTGTTVASKTSKLPVSDHLAKSTSGLRPVKTKSTGLPSPSTIPTKTTPIRGARPATSGSIGQGVMRSASKPKATPPSRPLSGVRPAAARPGTAPEPSRARSSKLPVKSSGKESSLIQRKKLPQSPLSSPRVVPKLVPKIEKKKRFEAEMPSGDGSRKESSSTLQIDEFFGEGKKSSQKAYYVEEEEVGGGVGGVMESEEEEEDAGCVLDHGADSVNIADILKQRKNEDGSSHFKHRNTRHRNLKDFLETGETTPLSLGYHDSSSESSDGEYWLEDEDALRDEGVEVVHGARAIPRQSLATTSTVRVEGVLCTRCACALGEAESFLSDPASSVPPSDFESASQVAGQVSFPQWTSEGLQSSASELTSSSQVTLQSEDTWGGLTPARPPQLHSDEESEVHLPASMPLQGHAWSAEATPQPDPYGWGQQND